MDEMKDVCFRHLQDNLIKRVPRDGSFRRLRSLRTLYVIEINDIVIGFFKIIFSNRDLRNNHLEEIDDDAFDGADSLNEL
jgi:hypothetical protein